MDHREMAARQSHGKDMDMDMCIAGAQEARRILNRGLVSRCSIVVIILLLVVFSIAAAVRVQRCRAGWCGI